MPDERSDAELIAIVEGFVLRARRVVSHSLCSDDYGLANLADGAWRAARKGGEESLQRVLPNEEVLESLAARVRPLILKKDPVHYGYVLNALATYLTRHGHPDAAAWCSELKKDWKSVDLESGTAGYYLSITQNGTEKPPVEITDVALAGTWFYGDLVHAKQDEIDRGKAFEIDQRYAAAAVRVAQLATLARDNTLSFVRFLVDDEALPLSDASMDTIPVKTEAKTVELTGIYSAPIGTELPGPAGQPLSEEWQTSFPGTGDGQWILRIPWGRND